MDAKLQLNGGGKLGATFLSVGTLLPGPGSEIDQTFCPSGHCQWLQMAGKVVAGIPSPAALAM